MVKKVIHRFLILVFALLSSFASSQGHDNPLLYHEKYLAEFKVTHGEIIAEINRLEKNWHCIENKLDLIKALRESNSIPQLNEYLSLLEVYYYIKVSNWESGTKVLSTINVEKSYFPGLYYYLQGSIDIHTSEYARAINSLTNAEKYLSNSDLNTIKIKELFITVYYQIDNLELAKKNYYDGITICEKNNYSKGKLDLYRIYGLALSKYDPDYSKEILAKGWELIQNESIDRRLHYAGNYLKFLVTINDWLSFEKVYGALKVDFNESCQKNLISVIETLYAHKLTVENKIDSAIYFNNRALTMRKLEGNSLFMGYSYINLSSNYLDLKKFSQSKIYLDSAKQYLYDSGNTATKRIYLQTLLKYFEKNRDTDSVFQINSRLAILNDKYFYDQQNFLIAKLNAENETNKILLENKYNAEIENRKLKLRYTTWISVLLLLLALILIFWLVNNYKNLRLVKLTSKRTFDSLDNYKKEVSQLKNVFENATTGLFIIDKTNQIKFVNKRAETIFSSFNYEVDQDFTLLFHGESLEQVNKALNEVITNHINQETQISITNAGRIKYLSLSISPLMVGNILDSILIIVIDVSDKVKTLELEKNQRIILQTLFNSINESIVLIDFKGTIKLINRTGAKRLGTNDKKLVGTNYFDILPQEIKNARVQKIQMAIDEKRPIVYDENIGIHSNMVSIYPSFNSDGELAYLSEFTQDNRDRRHAIEEINSLRQKVLRSQMNPHFIFNSLNAIQSYVLKNDSAHAVKYLNSFARLIRMILESSRYDYISLDKEVNILRYYLELQQLRFGDKFSYSLDVDENIETEMILIPAMLAQPFIENAIEHGLQHVETDGLVKISFVKATDSIIFKVSDNGIGREKSKLINKQKLDDRESLSTTLFKERLLTLNRYSGQKITYNIIDLKDDAGNAKGTLVIINLPIIYQSNIV